MRADARRNTDKLKAAALEVFRERGLQAPLKSIAQRAGVSPGTLYHLFGSRDALIDAVIIDLTADTLEAVAREASAIEDPWQAFAVYVERICDRQAEFPAIGDIFGGNYHGAGALAEIFDTARRTAADLIDRAQEAGVLRADFTVEDLLFFFITIRVAASVAPSTTPLATRRALVYLLDGLRRGVVQDPLGARLNSRS